MHAGMAAFPPLPTGHLPQIENVKNRVKAVKNVILSLNLHTFYL
jgi:hypothetical protein